MKLYHVHRENKYDESFKVGNTIEFGKQDNFLKETLFDISPSFTEVETLEDGKDIKKFKRLDAILDPSIFKQYSKNNQRQLLEMIREYIDLSSTFSREMVLEEVRRDKYPDRPSRFKCMFLTDEEGLNRWFEILKHNGLRFYYDKQNPFDIFEVEADGNLFVSTNKLLPSRSTKVQNIEFDAERYWNPTEYELNHSNTKEYLLEGTAKLIRKVK